MDVWQEIVFELWAYGLLAVLGALFLVVPRRSWRLPMVRVPPISWNGVDVFAACVLQQLMLALVHSMLIRAGLFDEFYGPSDNRSMEARKLLWSSIIAEALSFGVIIVVLQQFRGTRMAELGITTTRAIVNIRLGYLLWLVLTPATTAVYVAALYLILAAGGTVDKHFVSEAVEQPLAPVEWVLLFAGTVVMAPLLEELFFRGLMLPWQLRGGWEANAIIIFCALFFAAMLPAAGDPTKPYNPGPLVFVGAMLPVLLLLPYLQLRGVPREPAATVQFPDQGGRMRKLLIEVLQCAGDRRGQAGLAICANSLFFASLHSSVWPSPIPLFLLAIGLAWLRYRTSSLLGSFTLHALFNAVGALGLLFQNVYEYLPS